MHGGVSSVPVPFQLHCNLVSSGISSQSVLNILVWCVTQNERPILVLSYFRFSEMTFEMITFNHLTCHSSSTALGTRTGNTESQLREVQMKPPVAPQLLFTQPSIHT